jgi:diaminopropionate ammonia-lyase
MRCISNPFRATGLSHPTLADIPYPSVDAQAPLALLGRCPVAGPTALTSAPSLATACKVGEVLIKDERTRMGLGSFKALGAAFVIARDAAAVMGEDPANALTDRTYVAASAGNHGLSVAAGAAIFGARAIIYLSETVPEAFADRLRAKGAEVVREGSVYEDSMEAAERAADGQGWTLLSDSTWEGRMDEGLGVMEGYLQLAAEAVAQAREPPTHVLLQAGVGGLAAAVAAMVRAAWGDGPRIVVVEPEAAPALQASIAAGALVTAPGPVSAMGRLDCKTPSLAALQALSRDADAFATITEEEAAEGVATLARHGIATTPSGGAGLAALIAGLPGIGPGARVMAILSEGPEDG